MCQEIDRALPDYFSSQERSMSLKLRATVLCIVITMLASYLYQLHQIDKLRNDSKDCVSDSSLQVYPDASEVRHSTIAKREHAVDRFTKKHIRAQSCTTVFVEYQASEFEDSWTSGIKSLKSDHPSWQAGCKKMREDIAHVNAVAKGLELHEARSSVEFSEFQLSYFVYKNSCTGKNTKVFIEPLVSFLRHPSALCFGGEDRVLDKSYLMVPYVDEVTSKGAYKWLFDAGASTYDTGAGGASQSWFVNTYRARGIEFDRIIGWEAAVHDPRTQWNTVPADIKRKTSWYNIPATTGINDADNPLTFIKELAKVEDFVVFKLDIDAPHVEIELVQQIMNDPLLLSLIDEFYFEHHVTGSIMQWHGWGDLRNSNAPRGDIVDSYEIFDFLRRKGVRAHSWV